MKDDARAVERIMKLCEDVLAGRVKGEELDKAIEDVKVEVAKLRVKGRQ